MARRVRLTGANQIVGRIYVQSCDAFCNQTMDFLLGEVDCDAGIAKGAKFLGNGRDFMQNDDDNLAPVSKSRAESHKNSRAEARFIIGGNPERQSRVIATLA